MRTLSSESSTLSSATLDSSRGIVPEILNKGVLSMIDRLFLGLNRIRRLAHPSNLYCSCVHSLSSWLGCRISSPVRVSILETSQCPFSSTFVVTGDVRSVLQMKTNLSSPSCLIWYNNFSAGKPISAITRRSRY